MQYNTCSFDSEHAHGFIGEVRRLDTGGGGAVEVCREHYKKELRWRLQRIFEGVNYEMPRWEDLEITQEAVNVER